MQQYGHFTFISNIKKLLSFTFVGVLSIFMASCNSGASTVNNNNLKSALSVSKHIVSTDFTGISIYSDQDLILLGGANSSNQGGQIYNSTNLTQWELSLETFNLGLDSGVFGFARNSEGTLVTVGMQGFIATSANNGQSWTQAPQIKCKGSSETETPCNLLGIAQYENEFVAVGDFGLIIISTDDGKTWQKVDSGTKDALNAITVDQSGHFVAVGIHGAVLTSNNGIDWTNHSLGTGNSLRGAAVDKKGNFVAVGDYAIFVSKDDGASWTQTYSSPEFILYGITVDNDQFVAVGSDGMILASRNGENWTRSISKTKSNLYGITYSKEHKLFIAVGDKGTKIFSNDGYLWDKITEDMNQISAFNIDGCVGLINAKGDISITVPYGTNLTKLKAEFAINGDYVTVNNIRQISGQSINNFESPVTYIVHAANSSTKDYTVTVTINSSVAYAYIINNTKLIKCSVHENGDFNNCLDSGLKIKGEISGTSIVNGKFMLITDGPNNKILRCSIDLSSGELKNCLDSGAYWLNNPNGITVFEKTAYILNERYITTIGTSYLTKCDISNDGMLSNCSWFVITGFWIDYYYYNSITTDNDGKLYFIDSYSSGLYVVTCSYISEFKGFVCQSYIPGPGCIQGLAIQKIGENEYLFTTSREENSGTWVTRCAALNQGCKIFWNITGLDDPKGIAFLDIKGQIYTYIANYGNNTITRCQITKGGDLEKCVVIKNSTINDNPLNVVFNKVIG